MRSPDEFPEPLKWVPTEASWIVGKMLKSLLRDAPFVMSLAAGSAGGGVEKRYAFSAADLSEGDSELRDACVSACCEA